MAAQKVKLSAEEIEEIRKMAVNADQTIGARYPPPSDALLFADTPPLK